MKKLLLPYLAFALVLTSCGAYKATQTPDDLYYSPVNGDVDADKEIKKEQSSTVYDEDYLRMKTRNRNRWNTIDDYAYWNDIRYDYRRNCFNCYQVNTFSGFNNPWGWNNFNNFNPLWPTWIVPARPSLVSVPRNSKSNATAYRNNNYNNTNYNTTTNPKTGVTTTNPNGLGSLLKRAFTVPSTPGNNNSNTVERPVRSFSTTPSSNAGGNSGGFGSSGSSAGGGRSGKN